MFNLDTNMVNLKYIMDKVILCEFLQFDARIFVTFELLYRLVWKTRKIEDKYLWQLQVSSCSK